ncbi:MAG: hypothetical protein IPJ94_27185 [Chloroflexi bacterium]|nr:hypothetical protein [Chloroflexota bacterium]
MTGLVYEIGALRAVNDLLVDLSVNDFDVYVGYKSAGALVSAGLAKWRAAGNDDAGIGRIHPGHRAGDAARHHAL